MDEIEAIRARWANVGPWHLVESEEDGTPVLELCALDGIVLLYAADPDPDERALFECCAAAPSDIRSLIVALDMTNGALKGQSATNAGLLRRLARDEELIGELTAQCQQLARERDRWYAYYEELAGHIMILAGREMDRLKERRDADAPPVRPQRLVTEGGEHETLDTKGLDT